MRLAIWATLSACLLSVAPQAIEVTGKHEAVVTSQNGKGSMLVFYKTLDAKMEAIQQEIASAASQYQLEAHYIQIDDPSESELISRFDATRAPLPFVITLACNGAVTGAFSSPLQADDLARGVVSPATAKCLKALQEKKVVCILAQTNLTIGNGEADEAVGGLAANSSFGRSIEVIHVDATSEEEEMFLSQLGLDRHETRAQTVLLAPPGTTVGIYRECISTQMLIDDLTQASKGGSCSSGCCCPGGKCS